MVSANVIAKVGSAKDLLNFLEELGLMCALSYSHVCILGTFIETSTFRLVKKLCVFPSILVYNVARE